MVRNQSAHLLVWSLVLTASFGVRTASAQSAPDAGPPSVATRASQQASLTVPVNASAFADLFGKTAGDFRRLPSRENFAWLGIGIATAALAHPADARVSVSLSGSRRLDDTLKPGATMGGVPVQLGGALLTYAVGRMTDSPRVASVGADLFRAQIVSQAVTQAIKFSVRRTRPDGTSLSLPSGHTSSAFASATVLHRHFGWKAGVPAYAMASLVAASRIHDKRHFLSDVALGAAIGIVGGRTVTVGRGRGQFALAPIAAPGGGGLSFTWIGQR